MGASELVAMNGWPHRQVLGNMHEQDADTWVCTLFASDSPDVIYEVARRYGEFAIINPGAILSLAIKGIGPFKRPVAVRALTVPQSPDQLLLAVCEETELNSPEDIKAKRFPLKLSMRGQMDHSIHLVVNELLKAAGFSLDDIKLWVVRCGTTPAYLAATPTASVRFTAAKSTQFSTKRLCSGVTRR